MDNGASSYRRFLDGDESAFDDIMSELFYSLVFFINGYVKDIYTAEDIAMDTMADLVIHKHRYNFKVSLKTYLFMIGRSRALNCLKRRKTVDFTELDEAINLSDEKTLEQAVITNERKRVVNSAIAKLPLEMREAVHLVYFEDMTYMEAAKIMKKTKKQIDNLLYRSKKELYTILGTEGKLLL